MSKEKQAPKTGGKMPSKAGKSSGVQNVCPETGAILPGTYEIKPGIVRSDN